MNQKDNRSAFTRFDDFDLRVELRGPFKKFADEPASFLITQAVYVNGENLALNNAIDLVQLSKSCQLGGEFFIATCECGDAGCAGIDDGIRVTHFDDSIVWEVPTPLSYRDMRKEEKGAAMAKPEYRKFSFQPDAYLAAVQRGLRAAKAMPFDSRQPVECSPEGMTPEKLLALNPLVFSKRGAPLGCSLIGKAVSIDRFLNWVTINGISYRIRELPLPADIKTLEDWSGWEPKAVSKGFVFGSLAAPEWEVRRRARRLGKYLASILAVGGTVEFTSPEFKDAEGTRWKRTLMLSGQAAKSPPSPAGDVISRA